VSRLAQFRQLITPAGWFFVMTDPPDYEPAADMSVAAIAARDGRTPDEVAYDYLIEADNRYLFFPIVNYVQGDHEPIREMLTDPRPSSDGDAAPIVASIVDARRATFMLVHWGRESPARTPAAAGIAGQSAKPARQPISSASSTAADSRPACAPT